MSSNNKISDKNYPHYNDYCFKSILVERANGVLKFLGILYIIFSIILSEYTNVDPGISRIDFAVDAINGEKTISLNFQQTKI